MGYSNGNLSLNKAQKGEKGDKGQGLSFAAGSHYDIKKKRLLKTKSRHYLRKQRISQKSKHKFSQWLC